jgi:hypothetical protein
MCIINSNTWIYSTELPAYSLTRHYTHARVLASDIEAGLLSSDMCTETHSDMDVDKTIVDSIVTNTKTSLGVNPKRMHASPD